MTLKILLCAALCAAAPLAAAQSLLEGAPALRQADALNAESLMQPEEQVEQPLV